MLEKRQEAHLSIKKTLWLLNSSHAVRSGKQYMPISFHPREKCSCCMCTCMCVSPILFIVEICAVFLFIFTSSLTSMLHVQIVVSLHLLLVRIEVFLYVSHFGWTSYTTHDIFTLMLFIFLCKSVQVHTERRKSGSSFTRNFLQTRNRIYF